MVETSAAVEKVIERDEAQFKRLRIYNGIAGVFHLAQGLAILVLSSNNSVPITTSYNGSPVNLPLPHQIGTLVLCPLVAAFFFISALDHFLLVMPGIYEWYVKNLRKGANYARWVEYAFSASLMIAVIAMLSGIFDLGTLILLFFLNMMMILFGWMMELHNQTTRTTNWTAFYFGCLAGIVPWAVI